MVTLQKPRHADDHTLYLHAGNTVIDLSEIDENSGDWVIDASIEEMKYRLKQLREIKKQKNKV